MRAVALGELVGLSPREHLRALVVLRHLQARLPRVQERAVILVLLGSVSDADFLFDCLNILEHGGQRLCSDGPSVVLGLNRGSGLDEFEHVSLIAPRISVDCDVLRRSDEALVAEDRPICRLVELLRRQLSMIE